MDLVYILFSIDANDETTIIRVFSSFESAKLLKEELQSSLESRKKFNVSDFDRFFIDEHEVWK